MPSEFRNDTRIRWCEIAPWPSKLRYEVLSARMRDEGLDNSFEFIEANAEEFANVFADAQKNFDQIRLGGDHCQSVCKTTTRIPSTLLSLRSADAVMKASPAEGAEWWPRNFIADGVSQAIARGVKNLDLAGSVFILGANEFTRAMVASLVRFGFSKFNISHPSDEPGLLLVEELKESYFNAQFNFVQRHLVTQLPGVHSFAVNTLTEGQDDGTLAELLYFNFLKSSGVWLDLALAPLNPALEAEAKTVGAVVQSSSAIFAFTDCAWVKSCFGFDLDFEKLVRALDESRAAATPST